MDEDTFSNMGTLNIVFRIKEQLSFIKCLLKACYRQSLIRFAMMSKHLEFGIVGELDV